MEFAFFVAVAVAVSLWMAIRGSLWAVAVPSAVALLGCLAYVTSEPAPPGGGDADPLRLIATVLLIVGLPWLAVILVVVVVRDRSR